MYKSRSLLSLEVPLGHFFDCFLPWSQILFQGILTFFFKSVSVINLRPLLIHAKDTHAKNPQSLLRIKFGRSKFWNPTPIYKILDWFSQNFNKPWSLNQFWQSQTKLGPSGSTVRYEVMKRCTGLVLDSNGWYLAVLSHYEAVIDIIGSVEDIDALYI